MRPLPENYAGCVRTDCSRANRCWRIVGTRDREIGYWIMINDTESCDDFLEVPDVN